MITTPHFTVLLIEDDILTIKLYKRFLKKELIELVSVKTGNTALAYLQREVPPAAIILDLGLPDMHGIEIIKHIKQHRLQCAIIVITSENKISVVVEVMHYGIFDYLEKPVQPKQLIYTLQRAFSTQQSNSFIEGGSKNSLEKIKQYHKFIGASPPMQEVYQTITKVASSDATILITGETGTGKELCAHAIHQESQRQDKPYIIFNCATIPHHLMESELFGHVKGAFTGAEKARKGAALSAHGGTLFLDEIGEMDLELQKKLLRFVETKSFNKVGSDHLETVDIRFIFATNRHLLNEVKEGRFREDLYYRLKTIMLQLPPLRDRGDDVLLLAHKFLEKYSLKENKNFQGFGIRAEKLLLHYKWPGNVRQLKCCIQGLVQLNEGEKVTSEMLIIALSDDMSYSTNITINPLQSTEPVPKPTPQLLTVTILNGNTLRTFEEIEKDVILAAIEHCEGNVVKAATELGKGYATIYHKLQKWEVSLKRAKKS